MAHERFGARVRELRADDIEHVAARLRKADVDEITALLGPCDVAGAVRESVARSSLAWTLAARRTDEPVAVFGVSPGSLLSRSGAPWLVGTDLCARFPGALMYLGALYVRKMREGYPLLVNHVDARHEASIRWLRWLGFAIRPAAPHGAMGLPFHRFEIGG